MTGKLRKTGDIERRYGAINGDVSKGVDRWYANWVDGIKATKRNPNHDGVIRRAHFVKEFPDSNVHLGRKDRTCNEAEV